MINPTISTISQFRMPNTMAAAPQSNPLLDSLLSMPQSSQIGSAQPKPIAPMSMGSNAFDANAISEQLKKFGLSVAEQDADAVNELKQSSPQLFDNQQLWASIRQQPISDAEDPSQQGLKEYASLMGSMDLAKQASQQSNVPVEQVVSAMQADKTGQDGGVSDVVSRFGSAVNKIWNASKIPKDSPEAAGQKAFLYGLFSGLPFEQVAQLHSTAYRDALTAELAYKKAYQAKAAAANIDLAVERIKRERDIGRIRGTLAQTLGKTGDVAAANIAPLVDSAAEILTIAKDQPAVAEAQAIALMNQLRDTNTSPQVLDKLANTLAPVVKGGARADVIEGLQQARVPRAIINRYKFGIETDADIVRVKELMIASEKNKQQREREAKVAEQRALIAPKVEEQQAMLPGELKKAGETEVAKAAGETQAQAIGLESQTKQIQKALDYIDSGEHNLGSVASGIVGRGPIAQAIGTQLETTQAKNTAYIMDQVNKLAADGLKTLGSNPSTVDLQFWTKFKPNASSNPEFVREWVREAQQRIQQRLQWSRDVLGGGTPRPVGGSADSAPASTGTTRSYNPKTGKLE